MTPAHTLLVVVALAGSAFFAKQVAVSGMWVAAAATPVASAQPGSPEDLMDAPAPAGNAKRGLSLYMKLGCYQCHGTSGQGGGQFGSAIAPDPIPYSLFVAKLRRPPFFMPVYPQRLMNDKDAADVHAYLRSLPPVKNYKDIPILNLK